MRTRGEPGPSFALTNVTDWVSGLLLCFACLVLLFSIRLEDLSKASEELE